VGTRPGVNEVREWIGVPATVLTDAQLGQVLDAEVDKQAAYCLIPADPAAYPPALAQALYRRVARECAARSVPLGLLGDGVEFAQSRVPALDAQIESHEASYRITAIA
jgi:hypothetical protein